MHAIAAQLDDIGKPAWIALTIVSFILFWPLGLVLLGYLVGSGRMKGWTRGNRQVWQEGLERAQSAQQRWGCGRRSRSSGNRAFDEYRAEALRRLEEEQREFKAFLDRLRHAKDKAEFDQFMAERGRPSNNSGPQPQNI